MANPLASLADPPGNLACLPCMLSNLLFIVQNDVSAEGSINTAQLGRVLRGLGFNPTPGEVVDMSETVSLVFPSIHCQVSFLYDNKQFIHEIKYPGTLFFL